MRLRETLARINTELQQRSITVTSFDDFHVTPEILRDNEKGMFLRLHFSLTSGDYFYVDTVECQSMLQELETH